MERVTFLSRALELTRAVRDSERQARVIDAMTAAVEADLASDDGGPGVSLWPLRALVDLPEAERPDSLDRLLVRVDERYGEDPHISESVAEL
jgi:hypothetical protein